MSSGYPITLGIIGCFTLISLRPPLRPRVLGKVAYLMGLTVNEVPHLAAGLPLATATGQAVASGEIGFDRASSIPVAAAGVVGGGLVVIGRRGLRAWPETTAALRGAGLNLPDRPRGWAWRTLISPIPFRPRQVVRVADVRYGDHRCHRLDVYHRRDQPTGLPVLVYLHGGGYFSGGKHREGRALLHRLAAQGWVCVSADYRLRPSAEFEDHLADARRVLSWARIHAAGYGGDPDRVVMAGSSAGAHLTSLLALDPGAGLAAAICLYGHYGRYYGRTDAETVTSTPFALPAAGAPAFFIVHGDHDTWTPVEAARQFAAKLRRESPKPVVAVELPGGQHGFDLWRSWRYSAVLAGIEAFVSDPAVEAVRPAGAPGASAQDVHTTDCRASRTSQER
jgi:acetyl esterase/lipase